MKNLGSVLPHFYCHQEHSAKEDAVSVILKSIAGVQAANDQSSIAGDLAGTGACFATSVDETGRCTLGFSFASRKGFRGWAMMTPPRPCASHLSGEVIIEWLFSQPRQRNRDQGDTQ
jgi:hypothetical protein